MSATFSLLEEGFKTNHDTCEFFSRLRSIRRFYRYTPLVRLRKATHHNSVQWHAFKGMGSSDYSIEVNSDWIESAINVVRGIEDFSQNISTRKRHPCLTFGFFAGKPV